LKAEPVDGHDVTSLDLDDGLGLVQVELAQAGVAAGDPG
jgi:hypothetical protein